MAAQDKSLITVAVDGQPLSVFDTRSGGDASADHAKYRSGGGGPEKVRRARSTYTDVTVSREIDELRSDEELARTLRRKIGKAMTGSSQPVDNDDVPIGKPTTYVGTLRHVDTGEENANSGDGRMLTLIMTTTEVN